jgi:hypothetical protein
MAGLHLSQENFKDAWEGVMRTITKDDIATAFPQWYGRCDSVFALAATTLRKVVK